jgi:MFS family permease
MQDLEKNIRKLKWIKILHDFFIVIPILTIFFLARWLNMTEVFIIQAFFAFVILIWEVPSGYFADKYWRKLSIVIWITIWYIWMVLYPFWEGFWYFMIIEWIIWLWISILSWADSALLYDSLYAIWKQKDYHKIESEIFTWTGYWLSIASILWWFLATYFLELPFYVEMFFMFFTIPLALSLKEAPMHMHVVWDEIKWIKNILFHYLHDHKEIKRLIIFYWFLWASTLASVWFSQPFWQSIWIPISAFWIIWAIMTFCRALATKLSPFINEKLSRKNIFLLLLYLVLTWFIWLAIFDKFIWSALFMINFQIAFWISSPLFKKYINDLVPSKIRATVLSINSMFWRLVFVMLWPIIWYMFDVFTFREAFFINWIFFFTVWIISMLMMKKSKLI